MFNFLALALWIAAAAPIKSTKGNNMTRDLEKKAPETETPNQKTCDDIADKIPALRAFARGLVGDPNDADDLVQETMVKAISNTDKFEPGTRLKSWLFTILRNTYYSRIRYERRYKPVGGEWEESVVSVPADQEHTIRLKEIDAAFLKLSPKHQQALLVMVFSADSYEAAARICKCPVGTIKSRLSRARKQLECTRPSTEISSIRYSGEFG